MAECGEKYNYFFNKIVENDDDFVGSIAYVLYKKNKIEYIEKYKKEHENKEPDLSVLHEWQNSECTESKLDNYKKLALQKSTEFVNHLQKDKEKKLNKLKSDLDLRERKLKDSERVVNEHEKGLKQRDKYCKVKSKGQFWIGVSQSLVASFIFIIFSFLLVLWLSGNTDIITWLQKVVNHQ